MFAHISIGVSDFKKSLPFYDAVMEALGHARLFGEQDNEFMAYGPEEGFFIINTPEDPQRGKVTFNNGGHICFDAPTPAAVDNFYETAVRLGAKDGGGPGIREHYAKDYYAAFVYDYDGTKLEAMARHP